MICSSLGQGKGLVGFGLKRFKLSDMCGLLRCELWVNELEVEELKAMGLVRQ